MVLGSKVDHRELRWFGHVERMDKVRLDGMCVTV